MFVPKTPAGVRPWSLAGAAAVLSACLCLSPVADAAETSVTGGRFVMTPVDGGVLRMDTDSGVVSVCAKKGTDWRCDTVPDDYQALQKENEALKKQLGELRKDGAQAGAPQTGAPSVPSRAERKSDWPTDEEIDKGFAKLDRYLRKFKELIEKHAGPETPGRT